MVLVLFDIDGTILKSHGVGRRAVREALEQVCGQPIEAGGIAFAGRTDPQIMRDILDMAGLSPVEQELRMRESLSTYVSVLREKLKPNMVTTLPGVRELIKRLDEHPSVFLGLLTGNLEETAYLKLRAVDLDSHFQFGAFGSDQDDRYDLPEVAAIRAFESTGIRFLSTHIVIIGDTPHDIGCASHHGAHSIGVCTGTYDRAHLEPCNPDLLLDDLSDPSPVMRMVHEILSTS